MNIAVREEISGNITVIFEAPEIISFLMPTREVRIVCFMLLVLIPFYFIEMCSMISYSNMQMEDLTLALAEHMKSMVAALYGQCCHEASRCHSAAISRADSMANSASQSRCLSPHPVDEATTALAHAGN